MGQSGENKKSYEVTVDSLNIRKGPGVEYESVSLPLLKGARVVLLEQRDRWSKVNVAGDSGYRRLGQQQIFEGNLLKKHEACGRTL